MLSKAQGFALGALALSVMMAPMTAAAVRQFIMPITGPTTTKMEQNYF